MSDSKRCHLPLVLLVPLLAFLACVRATGEEETTLLKSPAMEKALSTLEKGEYGTELHWWAADERGGRAPGEPGNIQAGDYAARQFAELGLGSIGDTIDGKPSYFQYLSGGGRKGISEDCRLAVGDTAFAFEKDWSLMGGCAEAAIQGVEVIFAGYGITAPEYGYDDYEGIDARGKAVLILRYEPQEKDENSKWNGAESTTHAGLRGKFDNAKQHGAVAVLLVNGPLHHDPDKDPLNGLSFSVGRNETIPMVHVRSSVADRLLEGAGLTLKRAQKKIDREARPASTPLRGVLLDFTARVVDVTRARNVMGLLEGSDPTLKEEVVVIGAHYDHVGTSNGEVYNGADDNASGSVGVIELAEAFVIGDLQPRRSILFQLYDAEERGLVGSRYYVRNPAIPLEKTVAMINMDMIGRVREDECSILGTGTAEEWENILENAEEGTPITFTHSGSAGGGSDHSSFLGHDIPVLFFFTGMHPQYHKPGDDADLCNMEGAVEILNVVLKTALQVANRDERLTFKGPAPRQARQRRPVFGILIEPAGEDKPGLRITQVETGSAAEKAGLKEGDILLSIDEKPVNGLTDLFMSMRGRKKDDVLKVKYLRGDQELDGDFVIERDIPRRRRGRGIE
jgi:hypothetical protein